MKQIVVIGAGAAGMMSAWHAKTENTKVTILEALEKPGKKLLASGNGRCNLTFAVEKPVLAYRGTAPAFAADALARFTQADTLCFFESLGMLTKQRGGGMYPFTEQAQTVLSVLRQAVLEKGVRLKTRERVTAVQKQEQGFLVQTDTWQYPADAVILACGSAAAPALGGTMDGYTLAEQCGHRICPLFPALVPLKTAEQKFHALAGLRSQAQITLLADGAEIGSESGELQWTAYGISGIAVFQLSRFAAKALAEGKKVQMRVRLLSDETAEKAYEILRKQKNKRADRLFAGIFPEKLAFAIVETAGCKKTDVLTERQIQTILALAGNLTLTVTGTKAFDSAQVCAGGVDTSEVCSRTMESKKISGLFFAGEILDIDGACGGYNLQWAWSSGYAAGIASAGEEASYAENTAVKNRSREG